MSQPRYYYINGKISTCRRCKRKRTLDEPPEHLQFKTCYRCRMIERDQKKVHQKRSTSPMLRHRSPSVSHVRRSHVIQDVVGAGAGGSYYTRGGPTATSSAPMVMMSDGQMVAEPQVVAEPVYTAPVPEANHAAAGSSLDPFTSQLSVYNAQNIAAKTDPLSLPEDQQTMLQMDYLSNLSYEQRYTNALQYDASSLRPSQCLNCSCNLPVHCLGKQLCDTCGTSRSVIHNFNYFLTVLKANKRQDLHKVFLSIRIPVNTLLKSSMSADRSQQSIASILYDRYVVAINEHSGAEFVFVKMDAAQLREAQHYPVVRRVLVCARDSRYTEQIGIENIDPELRKEFEAEKENEEGYVQAFQLTQHRCNSLISLNYDTRNGDLTLCFSHQAHK